MQSFSEHIFLVKMGVMALCVHIAKLQCER